MSRLTSAPLLPAVLIALSLTGLVTSSPNNAFQDHYEAHLSPAAIPGLSVSGFVDPAMRGYNGDMNAVTSPPTRSVARQLTRGELTQSDIQISKKTPSDDTTRSDIPLFPSLHEPAMEKMAAVSAGARAEMAADDNDPLDEDCDSPQLGDVEASPQERQHLNMNQHTRSTVIPEQSEGSRDVLEEDIESDAVLHVDDQPEPVEVRGVFSTLPEPDKDDAKRNKCSRNKNGHDTPDRLGELDDDCGMPEPEIPCETPGNSTRCDPKPRLAAPEGTAADTVPELPAPEFNEPGPEEVVVEFVDYGTSFSTVAPVNHTVQDVIVTAGHVLGVEADHILLVRNAGAEVALERLVYHLEDTHSLVVYLKCADRDQEEMLLVPLRLCDTPTAQRMEVRVEVPETDEVYTLLVKPSVNIQTILGYTPLPLSTVSKVTYNGVRVLMSHTLNQLRFANKTAFIVYQRSLPPPPDPIAVAAPELSTHPTPTPAAQDNNPSPTAPTSGTENTAAADVQVHENPEVPVPTPEATPVPQRSPMKSSALVTVHVAGSMPLDFPIILEPSDSGMKLFDALHDRVGKPMSHYSVAFNRLAILQDTPLAGFGFVNGDVILVHLVGDS